MIADFDNPTCQHVGIDPGTDEGTVTAFVTSGTQPTTDILVYKEPNLPPTSRGARSKLAMFGAVAMAITGGAMLRMPKIRPDDYWCVACGEEIPPGKAGRKCKTCREPS